MNTILNAVRNGKVIASTSVPVTGEFIEYGLGKYAHKLTNGDNEFIQTSEGTFVNGELVIDCSENIHLDNIAVVGIVYTKVKDGLIYSGYEGKYVQHISKDRSVIAWLIGEDKVVMDLSSGMYVVTEDGVETSQVIDERNLMIKLYELSNKLGEL